MPDSTCTVDMNNMPTHIAVFRNRLAGDGAQDVRPDANSTGVSVAGCDVSVDDNDVSGLHRGLFLGATQSLDVDLFDVVARNSLHGNVAGLFVNAFWDPDPSTTGPLVLYSSPAGAVAAVTAYSFGKVFRDDVISGTPGTGFEIVGNRLYAPASTGQAATEVVGPVFDGCAVSGAAAAFSFECSEPRAGTGVNGVPADHDPGFADAAFAGCLVAGPGTAGSAAVTRRGATFHGVSDSDDPRLLGGVLDCDWQDVAAPYPGPG